MEIPAEIISDFKRNPLLNFGQLYDAAYSAFQEMVYRSLLFEVLNPDQQLYMPESSEQINPIYLKSDTDLSDVRIAGRACNIDLMALHRFMNAEAAGTVRALDIDILSPDNIGGNMNLFGYQDQEYPGAHTIIYLTKKSHRHAFLVDSAVLNAVDDDEISSEYGRYMLALSVADVAQRCHRITAEELSLVGDAIINIGPSDIVLGKENL